MNKKLVCAVLIPLIMFSSCSQKSGKTVAAINDGQQILYDEKAENVTKTETVYVNLDSSGKPQKVIVSNWIHTEKASVYVDDVSILDNIKNVKGVRLPQTVGDKIRWHMDEEDLYYSGTTNKTPPVLFDVEYYLDGVMMTPETIAGKSGNVSISIKIRNNLLKKVVLAGAEYTVSLPAVVLGGMILPDSVFSNVTVINAQKFNDGSKQLVGFATVPGFNESLGFASETMMQSFVSDVITVNAYAENFSLENMYFAVVPLATLNFEMFLPESLGDVGTAVAAVKAFRDAIQTLDPDRIVYSLISDEAKMNSLLGAVSDASDLYEKNKNLIKLAEKYSTPENIATLKKMMEILDAPEVRAMLEVIADPELLSFLTGLPLISEKFGDIEPFLIELQKDLSRPEVQKELASLPQTMETLSEITSVMSQNKREIDAIFNAIEGGGGQSLESVLAGINAEEMQNLEDKYGDVIEDSELHVALAEEWLKFGGEYGLFSGKEKNMDGSVMFIYKTQSIRPSIS